MNNSSGESKRYFKIATKSALIAGLSAAGVILLSMGALNAPAGAIFDFVADTTTLKVFLVVAIVSGLVDMFNW